MQCASISSDNKIIAMENGTSQLRVRQISISKDDNALYQKKILRGRRVAVIESRVPPLVLTRSGNAGRANYAPLSLPGRLPVQLLSIKLSIGLGDGAVKAKTIIV
jgi:hypothetical protein